MQTQPLISLHRTAEPITYQKAAELAAAANGFLLTFSIGLYDRQAIGDAIDQRFYEDDIWPLDSPYPADEPIYQYAIEYSNKAVVRGNAGADHYLGAIGANQVVYAGDGDDSYFGSGGHMIHMGAGNDVVAIYGRGPELDFLNEREPNLDTVIYDGAGRDSIEGGIVRAAIDGDTDYFSSLTRLSYADASSGVTLEYESYFEPWGVDGGTVYIENHGTDLVFYLQEIVGGSGDDWLSGVRRIQGGLGNDYISPTSRGEGGQGHDTLVADAVNKVTLLGEAGEDIFIFRSYAEATGGSGADTYIFEAAGRAKINDLAAGDLVDLSALLDVTIPQAFEEGHLKTSINNGYTTLHYDADGGGDGWMELAIFKGVHNSLADYLIA